MNPCIYRICGVIYFNIKHQIRTKGLDSHVCKCTHVKRVLSQCTAIGFALFINYLIVIGHYVKCLFLPWRIHFKCYLMQRSKKWWILRSIFPLMEKTGLFLQHKSVNATLWAPWCHAATNTQLTWKANNDRPTVDQRCCIISLHLVESPCNCKKKKHINCIWAVLSTVLRSPVLICS